METRPGFKTTEFWFALGAQLAVLLNLVGAWDWASNWQGGILGAVVAAAYALARGLAKAGVPNTPPPTG